MDTKDIMKRQLKALTLEIYIRVILFILSAWVVITTTIMAFSHPEYTQTQLFLSIPKAFVLNFN